MNEFPTNSSQGEIDFGGFPHPHSLAQLQPQQIGPGFPSRHTRAHSNVDHLPLPKGWERGYTPKGEMFYIDHNNRSTSWTHPSLLSSNSFFPQQGIYTSVFCTQDTLTTYMNVIINTLCGFSNYSASVFI